MLYSYNIRLITLISYNNNKPIYGGLRVSYLTKFDKFITQELREAAGSICSSKQNINKAEYVNELNFPYHESGVYN